MTPPVLSHPSLNATVRITGIRRGRFVEFDYSVGDRDLSVELIMPLAAFEEFCRRDGTMVLPAAEGVDLSAAHGAAGLYRPPA